MNILSINAGSSSIKYKAYTHSGDRISPLLSGLISGIGEESGEWQHLLRDKNTQRMCFNSHQEAFAALASQLNRDLKGISIDRVGHRVVHGGVFFYQSTLITAEVLDKIRELCYLAPIHNPVNIIGIELAQEFFPKALHIAIFDTAFHHTMPDYIYNYPIDKHTCEHYQIKRYGFHGINHEYVCRRAAEFLQKPLAKCHFISLHLGNGASACLVKNGKSFDTTMGMTPLAGLVMGTRCGDIDPAIPLFLLDKGMGASTIDHLLNKQSGLMGIAKENDMRRLLDRYNKQESSAILAINMYIHAIRKFLGAFLLQSPSLDALIFTGGVGENASLIRHLALAELTHMNIYLDTKLNEEKNAVGDCRPLSTKGINLLVIQGDEELLMAEKVAQYKLSSPSP